MKSVFVSLLVLASTVAAGVARAADEDPYAKNGPYIGIGASYGVPLFDASIENAFPGFDSHTSNSWGVNARGGYRFHKFLAAELEYEWLSHFGTRISSGGFKYGLDAGSFQTLTANLKVIAPYRQFQPYVLVGFGATMASLEQPSVKLVDYTHTSYSTRFGLGIDYYLTENVALNLGSEFVVNTAKISNTVDGTGSSRGFDYYSAQGGLTFKF